MAFGNYYGYNPIPQPTYTPPVPQPTNNSGLVWVQGIEAAKAYLVAPNNTVALWDSEQQRIYLKSADASGMPSMRVLDWTEHTPQPATTANTVDLSDYITKDEFNARIDEILSKIKETNVDGKPIVQPVKQQSNG